MTLFRLYNSSHHRGAALLTTLVVISLLTIIVISFFAMVGVAKRSSSYHGDAASLQNLRDSAVSLALAQIREGTTREADIWTSQPGVIRTFGESTGNPSRIYKLYSDDEMTVDASGLSSPDGLNLVDDVPSNWSEIEGQYVDLNEPVASMSDKDLHFPIVDPRLYDGKPKDTSETPEGFSYSKLHAGGGTVSGVLGPSDTSHPNDQRIPMPVKWIYQLRDGSLGTLNSDGTFKPFSSENMASTENPIVGRFAFWTDDESTKVNINTASEAIPWDTPRCATPEDIEFAKTPPVRNEVQRFGGHPAATCLSSVFFPNQDLDPEVDVDKFRAIYNLVPRVNIGGYVDNKSREAVGFDTDRIYSNVEEALLNPDREVNELFSGGDINRLSWSRFLLTANSRAPEITAAGTPRVCLWPLYHTNAPTHRTAYDYLVDFSTQINQRPYHFRRNSPNTNIGEYNTTYSDQKTNADLLKYLFELVRTPKQGYAKTLAEKYDPTGPEHNTGTQVVSFLETIRQINLHDNSTAVSGSRIIPYAYYFRQPYFGGIWIGSEVYGQVTSIQSASIPQPFGGTLLRGSEAWTNGVAREYTISEIGLALCLAAENKKSGEDFNPDLIDEIELPEGYKAIQVAQIAEGFNPAQGYVMSSPSSTVAMSYLSNLRFGTSEGDVAVQHSNDWGRMNATVAHLIYLSGKAPTPIDPSRGSAGDWWVGWGGSGGRYMYHSPYQPRVYSRGYFIVPSEDETITIKCPNNVSGSVNILSFAVGNQRNGDFQGKKLILEVPENFEVPVPEEPINFKDQPTWPDRYNQAQKNRFVEPEIIDPNDVVRTWVVRHGDHRLSYLREREGWAMDPNKRLFIPHPGWDPQGDNGEASRSIKQIHSFVHAGGEPEPDATFNRGLVRGVNYATKIRPDFTIDPDSNADFEANRPSSYPYSLDPTETRDWDTGTGIAPDGAYWGKIDDVAHVSDGTIPPYFSKNVWDGVTPDELDETSAPNQAVPSAVMFGSIPSAVSTGLQWTTLLFRPDITPGGHLGAKDHGITGNLPGAPPDHIILDWFWMPVVQPYALSERFSTAGKINMNYRIAPFSYIKRATGLHAALKSERLLAIPTGAGQTYKNYNSASSNKGWRHRIDPDETLIQFENKFDQGEVFKMESEICEQFLIPEGESLGSINQFWDKHRLTGDNVLERPYANLYPRLTTRSNVYRVHLIAQTLRKSRDSDPTKFDPELDTFVGEYRGESVVERAIDPNDPEIPDYVKLVDADVPRLDQFYNYRILYNRRFAP